VTYGPEVVKLDRASRIAWVRDRIAMRHARIDAREEAHKLECEACRSGASDKDPFLCMTRLTGSPGDWDDYAAIREFQATIESEERDAAYAARARIYGVDRSKHIDGWCSYWQNVRYRRFVASVWKCENCERETHDLEAHHLHYNTLGFEEIEDLRALCWRCHEQTHGFRFH
jgi:hypothetical protein